MLRPNRLFTHLVALAAIGLAHPAQARPDEIISTAAGTISGEVPDPKDPKKKVKVEGEVAARTGWDKATRIVTVAGVDITMAQPAGYELHFLNLVIADPNPPSWKDDKGNTHKIGIGEMYVDPLRGGNIPPGKEDPQPPADADPAYDGERSNKKASETGDFKDGEQKEYDLDDKEAFDGDRDLEKTYADAPTLTKGLEFSTFIILIRDKKIYRLGSFNWGTKADGTTHIDSIVDGPGPISTDDLKKALDRSGFGDYSVELPSPGACTLAALAACMLGKRRRYLVLMP